VHTFSSFSIAGLVAVLIGAILGGSAPYLWWGLAIALDLVAAGIGGQLEGWNLHPEHFVERHGLIVIITLGEALIVAAAGLAGATRMPTVIGTAVLAVAVTCGLWWSYFRNARPMFEHALAERTGRARSCMARDMFSVIHFPMLCGVIAMAAATEQALAHPNDALTPDIRWTLGAGAVLFVCGTAVALWRATGRLSLARLVLAPAAAVGLALHGATPWVAMTWLLAMLVIVAAIEHRQASTA
jgi:low temperature requirement protein LtrA